MNLFNKIKIFCIFIIVTGICLQPSIAKAADKTLPTIKVKIDMEAPTNQPVKVTIQATDNSGISKVKYAVGSKSANYFSTKGKILKLNAKGQVTIRINKNGLYSIYAIDKAGNVRIRKITISNIDSTNPTCTITPSTTEPINKNVTLFLEVSDKESGIKQVQYLAGKKTVADFINSTTAKNITITKNKGKIGISKNGNYTVCVTDNAGNSNISVIRINNIDKVAPIVSGSYTVMNQRATVSINSEDQASGVTRVLQLRGKVTDINSDRWISAKEVNNLTTFTVNREGNYSVMAIDAAGNRAIYNFNVVLEMRAMWISYLEFNKSKNYTETQFKAYIDSIYDNCVKFNMNTVIVQVRPMGDAMYKSSLFPWSVYASGTQGLNPGYDPMEYMVSAAHERGLEFHAWLNPYRVTLSGTDVSKLSADNQARKWRNSTDASKKRNVLSFDSKLFYNPARADVQNLIIRGVREIVTNYEVDGIHFDDYFYPSLGSNYNNNFDAPEYAEYVAKCVAEGTKPNTIVVWRRNNVNTLVRKVYATIKNVNKDITFGISPAGNISNLTAVDKYYVDIQRWLSASNYVDYICPQLYWTFNHPICPYSATLDRWLSIRTSKTVNMYVGLAIYRAGSKLEPEWSESDDVLLRQVLYGRDTGQVDGFMFFRYDSFFLNTTQKEVNNLIPILK